MNIATTPIPRDHCLAPTRADAPISGGRYRKLFPHLVPLAIDEAALHALGRPGGPCDLGVEFSEDGDSETDAIWPFFGQFVAHDITADRSSLDRLHRQTTVSNFRAPKANLEGLYGDGPIGAPYLYSRADPAKLLVAPSGLDVPRNHEGMALIGDPRNDSHLFVSQMQVAFTKLHNRLVDRLRADGVGEDDLFDEARRAATWHYQHVIVREFLPQTIGVELAARLLDSGPTTYRAESGKAYIPFEFADAAYRYGHAQIRDRYQVNASFGPCPVFPDLIGFGAVPAERAIDWTFHIGQSAQRAKKIDGRLPHSLINLPTQISGAVEGSDYASLATRDLERGQLVGLASGEAIARELGIKPLDPEQLGLASHGWRHETPLWLYILKEAAVLHDGQQLGPVGGRIVGEVLVGILDNDPESYRSADRDWQPTLPAHSGTYSLADILLETSETEAA